MCEISESNTLSTLVSDYFLLLETFVVNMSTDGNRSQDIKECNFNRESARAR